MQKIFIGDRLLVLDGLTLLQCDLGIYSKYTRHKLRLLTVLEGALFQMSNTNHHILMRNEPTTEESAKKRYKIELEVTCAEATLISQMLKRPVKKKTEQDMDEYTEWWEDSKENVKVEVKEEVKTEMTDVFSQTHVQRQEPADRIWKCVPNKLCSKWYVTHKVLIFIIFSHFSRLPLVQDFPLKRPEKIIQGSSKW